MAVTSVVVTTVVMVVTVVVVTVAAAVVAVPLERAEDNGVIVLGVEDEEDA